MHVAVQQKRLTLLDINKKIHVNTLLEQVAIKISKPAFIVDAFCKNGKMRYFILSYNIIWIVSSLELIRENKFQ